MIFLHVFLPILLNIWLYAYTITFKSDIKIPDFLRTVSKEF